MISQLDLVLDSFSRMDLESLEDLLLDDLTYSEVPKEIFLRQLCLVFQEFKERNPDLHLQVFRGSCCSRGCSFHLGTDGFRFFGADGDHLDLRFILKNKENGDVIIQDIFPCSRLISFELGPKLGKRLSLWFYEDDDPASKLSPKLLVARGKALEAEKNWQKKFQNNRVTLSEIRDWVMIHETTHQDISDDRGIKDGKWKWDKFLILYSHLKAFLLFCDLFADDIEVWKDHQESSMEDDALLKWVLDVEERLEDNWYYELSDDVFEFRSEDSHWEVTLLSQTKIILSEQIFGDYASFLEWFQEERARLVKYYFALTAEELDEFWESDPEPYFCYRVEKRLSYHLGIRNDFRKNGIFLPFGLG